jgi:rod shape determining protein RodA
MVQKDYMIQQYNKLDGWLLGFMFGLVGFGLLAIYSASNGVGDVSLFYRQFLWFLTGLGIMAGVYYLDSWFLKDYAYIYYGVGIALLLLVLVFGTKVAGQTSWVRIGVLSFQPSELAKVTTILALARFLSNDDTDIHSVPHILTALGIALLPALLVMLQPDMGTTLTYLSFVFPVMVMAGFNAYYLMLFAVPFVLTLFGFFSIYVLFATSLLAFLVLFLIRRRFEIPQLVVTIAGFIGGIFTHNFAGLILKPHQLRRIQTFIDPMSDPLGAGYNAIQAKIAIGSGGVFGKGFLEGTQTQLRFIPAQWTDFIFCVIGEELGLIGTISMLSIFLALLLRMLWLVSIIKNKFVELTLVGFVSLLLVHIMINVGMTIGLFPVIGVPLPFLSYGGTSLVGNMIMVAIALNFYRNKRNLGY